MELTAEEIRVLGCLVEKEATTPDNYPLTTNSLVSACNQTTNRDPIVHYDEPTVDTTMLELRAQGLARTITSGRANKHRHVLDEAWGLGPPELAVLALLGLRGPQTAAELRGRAERIHPFESVGAVESVLADLADRTDPMVVQFERQPGQKERRWAHLLGGEVAVDAVPYEVPSGPASATPTRADLAAQVAQLRRDVDRLYELLGEDRLADPGPPG